MVRAISTALVACLALTIAGAASIGDDAPRPKRAKPAEYSAAEPLANSLSLPRAGKFLDEVSVKWTQQNKCGACHTNYPFLMSRPLLKDSSLTGHDEVRAFFEQRIVGWDTPKGKPRWDTEVVATAAVLAYNDSITSGKLHPLTRQALDKSWTLQQRNGAWAWLKCNWPPFEHDDYYGATLAAVGVGHAPDNYAAGDSAREGLAKLRTYFKNTSAPDLHHKTWLMWASMKLDGLMSVDERKATIQALLALQKTDGGWSLPSLGDWKGKDGRENNKNAPSDGYATGFVVFVLRQTGMPPDDKTIVRGVDWLKTHQRESGQWFTPSLNSDERHYIVHAGTSFAVMALKACGE